MFALSRQEIALVLVTMLWGSTFLIIQIAMQHSGPLFFVGVRFKIAGGMALLLFRKHMAGSPPRSTPGRHRQRHSSSATSCRPTACRRSSSSQSAFITALYVPIVPLLQWAVLKKPPA